MEREPIIDVTGTPLIPSYQGKDCPGNGEHPEYECCCEECDYYLYCFPQYDWRNNYKVTRTVKNTVSKDCIIKTITIKYEKTDINC